MIPLVCAHCGCSFRVHPNKFKRFPCKACSVQCAGFLRRQSKEEIFNRHVVRNGLDKCWEWSGAPRSRKGYAVISYQEGQRAITTNAHRVSYELHVGPIPEGLLVCHTCDNPPCTNPSHLFLGTHADNAADRDAKGRHARNGNPGEQHGSAKLSNVDILEIRQSELSHSILAASYRVDSKTIRDIRARKTWRHIP